MKKTVICYKSGIIKKKNYKRSYFPNWCLEYRDDSINLLAFYSENSSQISLEQFSDAYLNLLIPVIV